MYQEVNDVHSSTCSSGFQCSLQNRAEAAKQLSDNYEAAIGDILKNSGVQGFAASVDVAVLQVIAAIGAVTLTYVRNRICAPRDMSAGAAIAFRQAVDTVLTSLY